MFFGLVFEQTSEPVELPAVEFLISTCTPIPRVTIFILSNIAQVTDGDTTDLVVDTLLDDVLGECVQEVVFPTRELLASAKRTT